MNKQILAAVAAAALAVPAVALAQAGNDSSDPNANPSGSQPGQTAPDQGSMNPDSGSNPGDELPSTDQGVEAGENVRTAMPSANMAAPDPAQTQKLFNGKAKTFEIDGKVTQVSPDQNQITISRTNMPDAQLYVADQTKITMKGQHMSMQDLQPGAEVMAKFNLVEMSPVAVDLKVTKPAPGMSSKSSHKSSGSMGNPNP